MFATRATAFVLSIVVALGLTGVSSAEVILHLDAGDLALGDGDPVDSWGPISSTGDNRPTYRSTGMNGNPSVDFDGADDYLGGGTAAGARSVVAVALYEGNVSLAGLISNGNDKLNVRRNGTGVYYRSVGQAGDDNDFYRHENHAGSDNVYVNAVGSGAFVSGESHVVISNAGAAADFTNFSMGRAAATGGAANRWWDGDVSEVYVLDQTLTNDEIVGISSYLAGQWGSTPVSATPAQLEAGMAALGVPEPSTLVLAVFGLLGLAWGWRRKR